MPIKITMPALSPTMGEGNLAKLLVKEGDKVSPGDVIAEIETDKATMEVEAVAPKQQTKAEAPAAPKQEPAKAEAPKSEQPKAEKAPAPVANGHAPGERVFASPLARRVAEDSGIDISAIAGTGPHGRVVCADVEAAVASGGKAAAPQAKGAPASAPSVKPMSDDAVLKLFEEDSYELVPHDTMRKTIARRLVEAKSAVPHFYLTLDCELDALLALRTQINAAIPVRKTEKDPQRTRSTIMRTGQASAAHQGTFYRMRYPSTCVRIGM